MSEFIASNGYRVSELDDGQVFLSKPISGSQLETRMWMRPDEAKAITEFLAPRSPAVQVDAEKVRAAVGEVANYGGMSALDSEQLEGVIDGITDGVLAALRSPVGDGQ